jgi:response regulator RpfG family c-di-GMP phosphodiesterase
MAARNDYGGNMSKTKPRILCVDDEPVNLKLFDAFLLPQGYEVLHASSGAQALEIVREQKVDLVLLDIMMPEMNGYEVCRKIKEDPSYVNIPVVMITSLQDKRERIKGIEAGAEDFISKPVDQNEVLARVRMLLRMRELNERLEEAYASVTDLATFGAETLKAFEPLEFQLMPQLDRLVGRIIRQSSETMGRPQSLIVGVHAASGWQWYHYEAPFREFTRRAFDLDAPLALLLPARGDSASFFATRPEFAARGLDAFVARLETHPRLLTSIQNLFCFLNAELCVFAANYGRDVGAHEAAILETLATQSLFFKLLSEQAGQSEEWVTHTVQALLRIAAFHDIDQDDHPERVGEFCALLSQGLGLDDHFTQAIRLQAQLHDVGNVCIPVEILRKEGAPDFKEWEIIRGHPRFGAQIIGDCPGLAMAHAIALSHHENWDGSGYPGWLRGEQIPLAGRIAALADRYDSLRAARPYKPALDHRTVCEMICRGSERIKPEHFDPAVLTTFQELAPHFAEAFDRLQGAALVRRAG